MVSGTVVSSTGTWVQRTAQDWLVLTRLTHHSGFAVGVTTGLQFLPLLLFAPYAGLVADRLSKRRLLACTQSVMGLTALCLGLLVISDRVQLWEIYAGALSLGVCAAFDNPGRQAFVSEVVAREDVTSAVSLNSASANVAKLVGPGLGGVLIDLIGTGPAFLVNAASFAAVLLALSLMRSSEMFIGTTRTSGPRRVSDGFRYIATRPDLLLVFAMVAVIAAFGINFQVTNSLMASGPFHRGAAAYGLLGSCLAIGSLSGALLAGRRHRPRLTLLIGSAISFGVLNIVGSVMPSYWAYAAMLIPTGVSSLTFLNSCNTTIQLSTPEHLRGRVLALYLAVQQGTTPLGAPVIGWIGGTWGGRWSVLTGGSLALLTSLAALATMWRSPSIVATFQRALADEMGPVEPAAGTATGLTADAESAVIERNS